MRDDQDADYAQFWMDWISGHSSGYPYALATVSLLPAIFETRDLMDQLERAAVETYKDYQAGFGSIRYRPCPLCSQVVADYISDCFHARRHEFDRCASHGFNCADLKPQEDQNGRSR